MILGLEVEAKLVPHYGYPKDTSILEDADTIVIFCTGHRWARPSTQTR